MCNAYTPKLVGVASLVSDATFKIGQIFLSDHGVHGGQKIESNRIGSKIYASGVGVTCMYANFGERGLFGFGDKTSFLIWSKFPFGPWTSPKTLASPW